VHDFHNKYNIAMATDMGKVVIKILQGSAVTQAVLGG